MRYDEAKQKEKQVIERKGCAYCTEYYGNSYYPDVCRKHKKSLFLITNECIDRDHLDTPECLDIDDDDIPF